MHGTWGQVPPPTPGLYLWAWKHGVSSKLIPHHTHSRSFDQRETSPAQKVLSSICWNRKKNEINERKITSGNQQALPLCRGLSSTKTLKPEDFQKFLISDGHVLLFFDVLNFILTAVVYHFFLRLKTWLSALSYLALLSVQWKTALIILVSMWDTNRILAYFPADECKWRWTDT